MCVLLVKELRLVRKTSLRGACFFLNFTEKGPICLIRVEHEKCSEMSVRIVRFGLKLSKWD